MDDGICTPVTWHRGWSVLDVTDPRHPEVIEFLRGPDNTFTGQVDLHGDTMITALEQGLTNAPWGFDEDAPFEEGVLITQTEDVLVDCRGFIYISDKNQGVWILRYTGPVRA